MDPSSNSQSTSLTTREFFRQLLKGYFDAYPERAAAEGLTEYYKQPELPDASALSKKVHFWRWALTTISELTYTTKCASERLSLAIMEHFARSQLWELEALRPYEYDPTIYNPGHTLLAILLREDLPPQEKLAAVAMRIANLRGYYRLAREHLTTPIKPYVVLATQQLNSLKTLITEELCQQIEKNLKNRDRYRALTAISTFAGEIEEFIGWLGRLCKEKKCKKEWRAGEQLYREAFGWWIDPHIDPQSNYKTALQTFEEALERAAQVAATLLPGKKLHTDELIRHALKSKVYPQQVEPAHFLQRIKADIDELTHFVREHQLVDLEGLPPLQVRHTPALARRWGMGASVSAEGNFIRDYPIFYNVDPLESIPANYLGSFLREYNLHTLKILSIHEAMPGHYVQCAYQRRHTAEHMRVAFNMAYAEGWAVYAERLMLETGYGKESLPLQLAYWKWFLRVVANTIIDWEAHVEGKPLAEIKKFLRKRAFQTEAEATAKCRRLQTSFVQLASYFTGFTLMGELRSAFLKTNTNSTLRDFHHWFLSRGEAPITILKRHIE